MNYKRKLLTYAAAPAILGLSLLGTSVASAHGFGFFGGMGVGSQLSADEIATREQGMFDKQAQMLGISVGEVKDAWAAGKTFDQIIIEKKLDRTVIEQRMKDVAAANMKAQLQTLVTKGIITQAQADTRLNFMQSNIGKGKGGKGHRGFGL